MPHTENIIRQNVINKTFRSLIACHLYWSEFSLEEIKYSVHAVKALEYFITKNILLIPTKNIKIADTH